MDAVTVLAAIAVVAVAAGLGVTVRRRHQAERREVENMFSTDGEDRVWWEDRR